MTVSAQEVCHQLLYQLRQSNLNFQVSETPYSAQILLRKRFLEESLGPAPYFNLPSTQNNHDLEDQLDTFAEENTVLLNRLADLEQTRKSERDTVKILEEKVAKVEAAALKSFEKSALEISTLKNANKNLNLELESERKENKQKAKVTKDKEREIQKLETKCENLTNNVRSMKVEMKSLKAENSKLSKKRSTVTVVKKKSCDASTVTLEYFLTPTLAPSSSLPSTPVSQESNMSYTSTAVRTSDSEDGENLELDTNQNVLNVDKCNAVPEINLSSSLHAHYVSFPHPGTHPPSFNSSSMASFPSMVNHWLPPDPFYLALLEFYSSFMEDMKRGFRK